MIGHPVPDLKRDHAPLTIGQIILERAVQVVWSLLIVVEHKMAADRDYFVGKAQTHSPASKVYLVNALVSYVAVAVVPGPVPVVVEAIFCEGHLGRGSGPQVVVDALRNGLPRLLPNRVAPLIAKASSHLSFADHSVSPFLDRLADCGCGAALRSVLDDAVVALGRFDQLLALPQVVRAGFFYVDVFARLARPDCHQRVPMVRSGNGDGIDRFVFEKFSNVRVGSWFGQPHLLHLREPLL